MKHEKEEKMKNVNIFGIQLQKSSVWRDRGLRGNNYPDIQKCFLNQENEKMEKKRFCSILLDFLLFFTNGLGGTNTKDIQFFLDHGNEKKQKKINLQ